MSEKAGKDGAARQFQASHRFARIAPRKARYVMDLVRGLPVEKALSDLRFSLKRATPLIAKVIKSAVANATQSAGLEPSSLFIAQALVDVGPTLKRFKPRAMGRAYPRLRRTCHLSVTVKEVDATKLEGKKKKKGGTSMHGATKGQGATKGKKTAKGAETSAKGAN